MKNISPQTLRNAVIVFVVIGIILLSFGGVLRPLLGTLMDPFISSQRWLSERFITLYDFFTLPRDVTELIKRNNELENEVSSLQGQVIQLQQQLQESAYLYALLDFARARPQSTYVASAVIGKDPSPFLQYLLIDHGSDDGLRHGMPVITQQGLVGRIDAVTASAARVQLITDAKSVVNVRLLTQKVDAQVIGSLTGDLILQMVPPEVELAAGEVLLTSGLGANYPSDIILGQVLTVNREENELFQSASIQPAVDFNSLRAVLVITNFRAVTIDQLLP